MGRVDTFGAADRNLGVSSKFFYKGQPRMLKSSS